MQVLLVRHGTAVTHDLAPTDEMRWLTLEGRLGVRDVARTLVTLGLRATTMYTSPLVRAAQTAEILAAETSFAGPIAANGYLSVDYGTTKQALAMLDLAADDELVVLVTHEPKIRSLAAHLAGDKGFPGFATGGTSLFEWDGRRGRFLWMISPTSLVPITSLDTLR